jgi:hypothetical protein
MDQNEEENVLLWTRICKQLKSGILALMKISKFNSKNVLDKEDNYQIDLFELLLAIFPFEVIFEDYCQKQKEALKFNVSTEIQSPNIGLKNEDHILALKKVAVNSLQMINEGYILLQHFCTPDHRFLCFQRLLQIYEEIVCLHIDGFLDFHNGVNYQQMNFHPDLVEKEVEASMFTRHDLKSFSMVFYILFNWSQSLKILFKSITDNQVIKTNRKENLFIKDEIPKDFIYNVDHWRNLFLPYKPLLKKVIPAYIEISYDTIITNKETMTTTSKSTPVTNGYCPRKMSIVS